MEPLFIYKFRVERLLPMGKVLLLSMPYGALDRPALGISLLKACLTEQNIVCDVHYFTFSLAEFIGCEEYCWISSDLAYTAFAGDWTFTPSLYGEQVESDTSYIQHVLQDTWRLDASSIKRLLDIRSMIPYFLDHCFETVDWTAYSIIGFTSTFEQNIASLALAKRIKEKFPHLFIVFGGANWEAEMGQELHRKFTFVDYVCSGQSEKSFTALARKLLAGSTGDNATKKIKGIVYRDKGESVYSGSPEPVEQMDTLPMPDYNDYFHDLQESTVMASVVPVLLLETSRGCWWGAKSHCTFCGLNGENLSYRSKSANRVLEELAFLVEKWGIDLVEVVDNMLDMKYFRTVLPELARAEKKVSLFYEVKANLTRNQIRLLHEAGVDRIQPGIESLSNHVLKLMRKGTSALINVQLLKWCKEFDVAVDWNLLYGFPGETREDYDFIQNLLPAIRFLGPMPTCGPIRMDRFSPYFNDPGHFGLINIRPIEAYKYIYPFDGRSLSKIASCFDFDYRPEVNPKDSAAGVVDYVNACLEAPEFGTLTSVTREADDSLILIDSRSDATAREFIFSGMEKEAYEYCGSLHLGTTLTKHLRKKFPELQFGEKEVVGFLDSLVANRLMVSDGERFLSLAIPVESIHTEFNDWCR